MDYFVIVIVIVIVKHRAIHSRLIGLPTSGAGGDLEAGVASQLADVHLRHMRSEQGVFNVPPHRCVKCSLRSIHGCRDLGSPRVLGVVLPVALGPSPVIEVPTARYALFVASIFSP